MTGSSPTLSHGETSPASVAYRVAEIRAAEDAAMAAVPEGALMARAARGLAAASRQWLAARGTALAGARVAVLAGSGNNGGDALFAAAELAARGARVDVLALSAHLHEGGAQAVRRAGGRVMAAAAALPGADAAGAARAAADADLVLDGIVGIGGSGPLRPDAARLARAAAGRVIAVDLPSGIDPDTGVVADPNACIEAEVTVTFGALKAGLVLPDGCWRAGAVQLVDIGLDPYLRPDTAAVDVMTLPGAAAFVAPPGREDDKYTRGVVGVVAGSQEYPGAGILCTGAARFGGAGMVRYAGGAPDPVITRWPEVVPARQGPAKAGRAEAWIVGPGGGTDDAARGRLADVLAMDVPVLVDADAITLVAQDTQLRSAVVGRRAATLFTPHAGEFARLGGQLDHSAGRAEAVRRLAAELRSVVLLKGAATIVAAPDGPASVSSAGPPDLATAGSGDVLSGLIGSMLAAQRDQHDDAHVRRTAAAGAYLHGVAGQIAAADSRPIVSEDVLNAVPSAIATARRAVSRGDVS
ncbi:MAG: NAD(P)H-hydrate dehydratase [Candidatus Nanopelagicales bacterium]